MTFGEISSLSTVGLFVGILIFIEIGRRFGIARLARNPDGLPKGIGPVEGAAFSLLGLLLAFTFSGAASRFVERRHMVAEEAHAIESAYLRVDLLPSGAQPEVRELFRCYLDLRLDTYRNPGGLTVAEAVNSLGAKLKQTVVLQEEIWTKALTASQGTGGHPDGAKLLLPALNEMFGFVTSRAMATENHPPMALYLLLVVLSFIGSMLVGYATSGNKGRIWLHMVIFAILLSLVIFVIVNLEFPRLGLIRVDPADHFLADLRQLMR
jgi:hypothetical protein